MELESGKIFARGSEKFKMKIMFPAGFERMPLSPRQENQRFRPLGHAG